MPETVVALCCAEDIESEVGEEVVYDLDSE